ncbi:hypothetical protein ANCCAN_13345, partial [Ancylostoma caninum]
LSAFRCRFGKPLLPKHGLISNVVTAVQQKVISDCYLVPVSYTYDNVAEGVFLDELMGIPKKRESVLGIITGVIKSFGMPKRCGAVRIHYGNPVLLSDYINALHEALISCEVMPQLSRIPHTFSYRELVPWHSRHKEKADDRSLIRAIGYHVLYEAQSIVSISLVSIVSALLMCKFRQSVPLEVLSADCQWLCDQIVHDGSDVMGWHKGETCGRNAVEVQLYNVGCSFNIRKDLMPYALQYLRDSVERYVDLDAGVDNVVVINTHRQLVNLAFNKNALVPLFALRSAIALAMVSRSFSQVHFVDVVDDVALICDWMQFEVIFCKPCEDLRALIAVFIGRSGLSHIDYGMLRLEGGEEDEIEGKVPMKLEVRDAMAKDLLMFYSNFLRPFLQSLYIVIARLLSGDDVTEGDFIYDHFYNKLVKVQLQSPKQSGNGAEIISRIPLFSLFLFLVSCYSCHSKSVEAVNSDSFRNSLRFLRYKTILSSDSKHLERERAEEIRSGLQRLLEI